MFIPLYSSANQELFKKYICNQNSHYEKYDGATCPSYRLKLKYPLPFSVSSIWLIHNGTNQKVFEKHLCNKSSHYVKYGRFLIMQKEAIMCNH